MSKKPTAQVAESAAPSWATLIWCDLSRIYVQLPSQNGPCVVDYPRDAHGLSDILNLMKSRHASEGHGKPYNKRILGIGKAPGTPNQRDAARELLLRKGIIGVKR